MICQKRLRGQSPVVRILTTDEHVWYNISV